MPSELRWTIGDLEEVERLADVDFAHLADEIEAATLGRRLRICAALVYVQRRKTDPTLTFEAARDLTAAELLEQAAPILEAAGTPVPLPG